MPFCEKCSRYWTPTAMDSDGSCPKCGRHLESRRTVSVDPSAKNRGSSRSRPDRLDLRALASGDAGVPDSAPWHFKLLVTCLVLYLGWRIFDLFI